ncbi:PAS domain S-box protein [Metabacillus litoralis]|uniref:PAS domain-containing sensor histidine kinase n=1 Tax=Metabacillus TaxID=2675233 RepID=UPI000EF57FFF|nr:PAS domain-containing sensor histidine kinase [Metabacillus litoralis]UHA62030.1 PAS domain S-box protein [Metabacillus litoralis]
MIQNDSQVYIIINEQGTIESFNLSSEKLFGHKQEDVKGKKINMLFPYFDVQWLHENDCSAFEMLGILKDQSITKFQVNGNKLSLLDQVYFVLHVETAKEQESSFKKMKAELKASLSELMDFKFALDESSIVAITDQKGIITYVNETFCKISKYSTEELIGKSHKIINSGYHSPDFFRNLWKTIGTGKVWKGEIKNRAKDGTYYWVDTTIVPFLNGKGKPYQYLAIRNEITGRKRAEKELQRMMSKLIGIQEEERKKISRELHDGIGQNLYSLLIMINRLRTDSNQQFIEQMETEISNIIDEIRQISWQLRPSILDDLGLIPAIRSFINKFNEHYGLKTNFTYKLERRLDSEVETSIYRIVQEAMTNARKYAKTNEISLSIIEGENELEVVIDDHGVGFDQQAKRNGVGLFSMEERARSIEADFQVQSQINEGTRIKVKVPFK